MLTNAKIRALLGGCFVGSTFAFSTASFAQGAEGDAAELGRLDLACFAQTAIGAWGSAARSPGDAAAIGIVERSIGVSVSEVLCLKSDAKVAPYEKSISKISPSENQILGDVKIFQPLESEYAIKDLIAVDKSSSGIEIHQSCPAADDARYTSGDLFYSATANYEVIEFQPSKSKLTEWSSACSSATD
ncbi:hypothetical protein GOA91_15125 [Sinorhizobium meliloti]|nr:hypothetical protein [Sinorhizobium meliloti]